MFLGALAAGVGVQLTNSESASAAAVEQYGVESKLWLFVCLYNKSGLDCMFTVAHSHIDYVSSYIGCMQVSIQD